MRTLAVGNDVAPTLPHFVWSLPPEGANFSRDGTSKNCQIPLRGVVRGFTLLELLLVVAIIAVASAGVSFALRDSAQTQLEREAQRLAALLESARSRSLASGIPVRWRSTESGFVFEGLPDRAVPQGWLSADVTVDPATRLVLGPEPIIPAQSVQLASRSQSGRSLSIATDGVRPFGVSSP